MQTIFTVNFDDPDSILDIALPLMKNSRLKSNMTKLAFGIINNIDDEIECGIEQVTKILQSLSPTSQNPVDVKFMLQTFLVFSVQSSKRPTTSIIQNVRKSIK